MTWRRLSLRCMVGRGIFIQAVFHTKVSSTITASLLAISPVQFMVFGFSFLFLNPLHPSRGPRHKTHLSIPPDGRKDRHVVYITYTPPELPNPHHPKN